MSTLITLTRHVNHEKMLRRRFLTPLKQIKNEIVGANEAVGNHPSIYLYILFECVPFSFSSDFLSGVAAHYCGGFQCLDFNVVSRPE